MSFVNHHAHSNFSDGYLPPVIYIQRALEYGMQSYGFSDHAPIPGEDVSIMTLNELEAYLNEIDKLKEDFGSRIQIYKSLEVDYIPEVIDRRSPHIIESQLDYVIGAVHYIDKFDDGRLWGFEGTPENFQNGLDAIFSGDIQAVISRYYSLLREMVTHAKPDIVAHLDRIKKQNKNERFFQESDQWYRDEVIRTLESIAASGAIMEVNTKGYYRHETEDVYPGKWVLEIAHEMDIPVHLASDAHHPDHILSGFEYGSERLKQAGYTYMTVLSDHTWHQVPLKTTSYYMSGI